MLKKLLLGNRRLQNFWWKLYKLSIKGLNYDRGHVPSANGEEFALKYALSAFGAKENIVLFDVGANRGQYLTMAKNAAGERLQIYCIEPNLEIQGIMNFGGNYIFIGIQQRLQFVQSLPSLIFLLLTVSSLLHVCSHFFPFGECGLYLEPL